MRKIFFLSVFTLAIVSSVSGQFILKGEFRPRFEYRAGYGKILSEDEVPVGSVSQRSRLSAYYQDGIFSCGLAIQDVMVWGDEDIYSYTGVFGNASSIDLNEAWIAIKPYKNGLLKAGRQYWVYEDQRLLAKRGWNQSEIKYDALLFQHTHEKLQADVGMSWNNDLEKTTGNEYPSGKMKSMNFVYLKKPVNEWIYVSVLALVSGFTESDTASAINWSGTYGAYAGLKKGAFKALLSGFYQNGNDRKGIIKQAYMFSLSGDYSLKNLFSFGAGIDYLSGNDQDNNNTDYRKKNHAFDNLYGARHSFFGHMDLFNNLPKSTADGGLVDAYLKMTYTPVKGTTLSVDFHVFNLQNNILDKTLSETTYLPKSLGEEIDLNVSWDISKVFNVTGGYSFFLVTDSMEKLQGLDPGTSKFPSWAWVMITAKPVFLDSSKN